MSENKMPMHYVCTLEEATQLVHDRTSFWVCNCGCREGGSGCQRSRLDVCLSFAGGAATSGTGKKEITIAEAAAILEEAKVKRLVSRPFRDESTRTAVEGICFCCDDCCAYFLNQNEVCDKGKYVEETDMDGCTLCGDCIEVCHFKARAMKDDNLEVERDLCYGCGLCAAVCPTACIEMVARV
jgi:Pyruvate/2-oxoacid:ferredoxin oxidoreductase delta subunit